MAISTLDILNKFFLVAGGRVVSSLPLRNSFNQNPLTDPKTIAKIHRQLDRTYRVIATRR